MLPNAWYAIRLATVGREECTVAYKHQYRKFTSVSTSCRIAAFILQDVQSAADISAREMYILSRRLDW